ncbi:MAG: ABC transporter ATP-binding protein [Dehalococcoidia bacterium]
MPAVVELQDIVRRYQMGTVEVWALRGLSLSIERGEMVAIMGPSGSGKSTLMHIIGCLDRPTSGSYLLEGEEVGRLGEDQLAAIRNRHIGFVFQTFNLLHRVSALGNVELPLIYGGGQRSRAKEALERVGLGHRASHRPSQLSGGEQQRVAIARALVNQPSLILADEPTGNLDSGSSHEIMEFFKQLNREEGITMVVVTHEADIAAYMGRVVRLRDGMVVDGGGA